MKAVIWIAAVAILILLLLAVGIYFIAYGAFTVRKRREFSPEVVKHYWKKVDKDMGAMSVAAAERIVKETYNDVYITSFDGLKLHAYEFEYGGSGALTVVLCHGYKSCPLLDFSLVFEMYKDMKYNILLIDQRAHGLSEGKYICFGVKECRDAVAWCDYASKRFGGEIVLEGLSMGASTVMFASSLDGLPESVVRIIADCGFCSPYEQIAYVAGHNYHMPVRLVMPLVSFCCQHIFGFDLCDMDAEKSLSKCKIPVLFLHGEDDGFVPVENVRKAYSACSSAKRLITVKGAGHGMSYMVDMERCQRELIGFLRDPV